MLDIIPYFLITKPRISYFNFRYIRSYDMPFDMQIVLIFAKLLHFVKIFITFHLSVLVEILNFTIIPTSSLELIEPRVNDSAKQYITFIYTYIHNIIVTLCQDYSLLCVVLLYVSKGIYIFKSTPYDKF